MSLLRIRIVLCMGLFAAAAGLAGCPPMVEPAAFDLLLINEAPRIFTAIEVRDRETDEFVQLNTEDLPPGSIVRFVLDYDQFANAEQAITVRVEWVSSFPDDNSNGTLQSTQVVAPDGAGLFSSIWTEDGGIAINYSVVEDASKVRARAFSTFLDALLR